MKARCLLFVFIFVSLIAGAQNATLTKGETIEYLHKKIMEVDKQTTGTAGSVFQYPKVLLQNGAVKIEFDMGTPRYTYVFNPAYIKEVTLSKPNQTTGWVLIELMSKAVAVEKAYAAADNGKSSSEFAWLPFLIGDGKNFDRIKKALLHLQALIKAEDDPFN
jgi:hypothetical protein